MTETRPLFGPFVHSLNKGGLFDIAGYRRLKGAGASNYMASDRLAVRAWVGSFEHQRQVKRWSDVRSSFVEFMTYTPPRSGLPPGYAEWSEEQLHGGYLEIHILRILDGSGRPVSPNEYAHR